MITPEQQKQALTMRAVGYTHATIAAETGISVSGIKGLFKRNHAKRGSITPDVIEDARKSLLTNHSDLENVKRKIAVSIEDDLALINKTRLTIATTLEEIENDSSISPHIKARAIAAIVTSLSLTQAMSRKALNTDRIQRENHSEQIPELVIRGYTPAEEAEIVKQVNNPGVDLDDDDDIDITEEDNDIVTEGV
jgi:hypothetical protein